MSDPTPPMPTSEAEWAAHWAFYKLALMQRDAAWREIERLRDVMQTEAMAIRETLDEHTDVVDSGA